MKIIGLLIGEKYLQVTVEHTVLWGLIKYNRIYTTWSSHSIFDKVWYKNISWDKPSLYVKSKINQLYYDKYMNALSDQYKIREK